MSFVICPSISIKIRLTFEERERERERGGWLVFLMAHFTYKKDSSIWEIKTIDVDGLMLSDFAKTHNMPVAHPLWRSIVSDLWCERCFLPTQNPSTKFSSSVIFKGWLLRCLELVIYFILWVDRPVTYLLFHSFHLNRVSLSIMYFSIIYRMSKMYRMKEDNFIYTER